MLPSPIRTRHRRGTHPHRVARAREAFPMSEAHWNRADIIVRDPWAK
ncbi:hypothetical protein [Streptomyces osmaniensis]|nr:hypothetical protein KJK32_44620 [Streptomyces sp. JCM17656]